MHGGTVTLLRGLYTAWLRTTGGITGDGWVFAHDGGVHWSPSYVKPTCGPVTRTTSSAV